MGVGAGSGVVGTGAGAGVGVGAGGVGAAGLVPPQYHSGNVASTTVQSTMFAAVVRAAASVSAPLDLTAAGEALGRGFNLVYTRNFLATLKRKSAAKLARFPGLFDGERVVRARTLREFDDVVTAPLHGFRDVADYWARASSKPWLRGIEVPTLVLNAANDPFLPVEYLPRADEIAPCVVLECPATGGHAGFVSGPFPGRYDWLPRRILAFFEAS